MKLRPIGKQTPVSLCPKGPLDVLKAGGLGAGPQMGADCACVSSLHPTQAPPFGRH